MQTLELRKKGQTSQSLTMIAPKEKNQLENFIHLLGTDGQSRELPNDGIAITQKAAELFGLAKGDTVSLYTDDQKELKSKKSVKFYRII